MEYRCPYCGEKKQNGLHCRSCLRKIDWVQEIEHKSVWYYNRGYEAAVARNLTGASYYLKKALLLDKYHVQARNLLGLIYFEIGQVGMALKEWMISESLHKEDNLATYYIKTMQERPKILSEYKESVILYNKALDYLKQKNIDMGIMRLKKAMSKNPNFVEARILMGLSYMYEGQSHKASEQIKKALFIDHGHEKGLFYYKKIVEEDASNTRAYEVENRARKMKPLLPSKVIDREKMFRKYLLYFLLGAVGIWGVDRCLILPSRIREYQLENARLSESEEQLVQSIQTLTKESKMQIAELEKYKSELENQVAVYEKQLGEWTQKEKMTEAKEFINQRSYIEAAQVLYRIEENQLEESYRAELVELKKSTYPRANDMLYSEGMRLYNQEQLVEAHAKFETLLLYEPNERLIRKSLYAIGCIYEKSGNLENAKLYFQRIIEEAKDTREAKEAQRKLENIATN